MAEVSAFKRLGVRSAGAEAPAGPSVSIGKASRARRNVESEASVRNFVLYLCTAKPRVGVLDQMAHMWYPLRRFEVVLHGGPIVIQSIDSFAYGMKYVCYTHEKVYIY